ncbi:MAG: hypothetical protein ACOYXU_00630 [Nitrospirota bacterium]
MTARWPRWWLALPAVVAACAGPAALTDFTPDGSPRLGPEIVVSSRAADEEEDPVPSWNGTRFLVVWQSTRRGPSDIYGAWVSPDGAVAPADGFPISEGPADGLFPDVAWSGDAHLAVWQDLRSRRNWEVYGARVRPDGTVLDPEGLAVGAGSGNRRHPRVAWSGRVFLAAWMQERPGAGWDIAATRIAPDGRVLDPEGIVVGGGPGDQTRPAVAWNGRTFVVAWMDARRGEADLSAARVDEEGRVLDPAAIAVSTAAGEQGYPAVGATAASDGESVIVWVDKRGGGHFALYGATLAPDGRVAQPDGVALSSAPRLHMFPAAACRGTECLIVWEEEQPAVGPMTTITDITRDVRALRWTGGAVKPFLFTVEPDAKGNHFTTVAAGDNGYLVAWKEYRTGRAESLARVIEFAR